MWLRSFPSSYYIICFYVINISSSFNYATRDNYYDFSVKEEWRPFLPYLQLKLHSDGKICAIYTSIYLSPLVRCLACYVIVSIY
jgi:hypothetical protein